MVQILSLYRCWFVDLLQARPDGLNLSTTNLPPGKTDADFEYRHFRALVEGALRDHFGESAVEPGNRTFHVNEDTYRVDADITPVIEHRRYAENGWYQSGVSFMPDSGGRVVDWPKVTGFVRSTHRYKSRMPSLAGRVEDGGSTQIPVL